MINRILRDEKLFYPACFLFSALIIFIYSLINKWYNPVGAILNIIAFVSILLVLEKLILTIYKGPFVEIRGLIFLFLFLSPFYQYYLTYTYYEYFCVFFLLFSFYNFSLYEKLNEKGFLFIAAFSTLLSVYFHIYSFFAILPVLLLILMKSRKFIFLLVPAFIIIYYLLIRFDILQTDLLLQWNFNNFFNTSHHQVTYNTPNIIFAFFPLLHPVIFLAGIVVIPFIRSEDFDFSLMVVAAVSFITYALFIAGLPNQDFSNLLITFPLLLLVFYPAMTRVINLTEYFRPKMKNYLPYIITLVQIIFIYMLFAGFLKVYI